MRYYRMVRYNNHTTIRDRGPRFLRCGTAAPDRDRAVKVNSFQNRFPRVTIWVKCKMAVIYELRMYFLLARGCLSRSHVAGNKWYVDMLAHFTRVNVESRCFRASIVLGFGKVYLNTSLSSTTMCAKNGNRWWPDGFAAPVVNEIKMMISFQISRYHHARGQFSIFEQSIENSAFFVDCI